jgi:uncharacterized protein (DUF2236 family)
MACPAGYTEKDLHLLNGAEHPGISNHDVEKAITMFRQVEEPTILQKEILPEPAMILAAQYAILMQWCKYGLARGSLEHSDFANRVLQRLITTTRYLNVAVYGTPEQKANITSVIHRYHSPVKGVADSQGEAYSADDPELHRWTAATLFVGFYEVYEMIWGPMDKAKKTKLMKECATFGTCLRMPPEMWFDSLEEFYAYWNHNVDTLEVTHWARELADMLLYPKVPLLLWLPSKPLAHFMRTMAIHFLPPRIRQDYKLKYGTRRRMQHEIYLQFTRVASKLTPRPLRHMMVKPGLWDMKKASKRIEKTGKW